MAGYDYRQPGPQSSKQIRIKMYILLKYMQIEN